MILTESQEANDTLSYMETQRGRLDTQIWLVEQRLYRARTYGDDRMLTGRLIQKLEDRLRELKARYARIDEAIVAAVQS